MSLDQSKAKLSESGDFAERMAQRVFVVLHGYYGNQWTDKFRSGMLTPDGQDAGVLAAQAIWAKEIGGHSPDDVRRALDRVKEVCAKYPPSLPEFLGCLRAVHRPQQRLPQATGQPSPMPAATRDAIDGIVKGARGVTNRPVSGLPVLLRLVSEAVGLAGGDESMTLLTLERAYGR